VGHEVSKIEVLERAEWLPWQYADQYELQSTSGPSRLAIGPSSHHADLVLAAQARRGDGARGASQFGR